MRQVFVIHGGDSFATYEEYIQFLKDFPIDLEGYSEGWKSKLPQTLGDGYEVIQPSMPNKFNAKYAEWKLWFQKYVPFVRNGVVLVGHSLGGSFLAKFLAEEKLPVDIAGTFLIAAPYDEDDGRKLVEFDSPESLALLGEQGGQIFLYQSKDDTIVNFKELTKFQNALPNAHARIFEDRHHFLGETFPEIIDDIKSLR
jgi:predicted alpha/beta hydrolase family esterase